MHWRGILGLLLAGCLMIGCELLTTFDRTEITGGSGGLGSGGLGGGGTGQTTTTGGGGTGGAMCVDAATDCTDALSAACKMWTCDADGGCAEADVPDGADATTQTDGDCKKNVCMGGAATPENDDADPFNDGNDCTVDSCNAGTPTSDPAASSALCAMDGGKVCDGMAACVECIVNGDCADPTPVCSMANNCITAECTDQTLNGTETDVDCGGRSCDPCDTAQLCAVDADCYHGKCDLGAGTCAAPTCSDGIQNGGMYQGNDGETDVDCGGPCGPTCGPNKGCDVNGDCVGNQCSGMGGACVPNCADMVKNNVETDIDCGGGTCGGCAVGDDCGADTDCVSTAFCNMGVCAAKKPLGAACMGNNQCTSTTCADGVCCNSVCSGTCQACNIAGNLGSCGFIAVGTDPANECNGNGGNDVCSGNGACAKADGTTCAGGAECASGNCIDGVCCNTACAGTCKACSAAKTGGMDGVCDNVMVGTDPELECTASLNCDGAGACQALLVNGTACTVAGECASSQCIDGFCCDTTCGASCQACDVTGMEGACSDAAEGLQDTCMAGQTCVSGACNP